MWRRQPSKPDATVGKRHRCAYPALDRLGNGPLVRDGLIHGSPHSSGHLLLVKILLRCGASGKRSAGKIGQGIVYSSFEGIGRNITGTEKEIIYRLYYLGHKAAVIKELTPSSILIDCHSFPSDLSDVEVCIGFNDDWSMPDKDLLSQIESMFRSRGYKRHSTSLTPTRMHQRHVSATRH